MQCHYYFLRIATILCKGIKIILKHLQITPYPFLNTELLGIRQQKRAILVPSSNNKLTFMPLIMFFWGIKVNLSYMNILTPAPSVPLQNHFDVFIDQTDILPFDPTYLSLLTNYTFFDIIPARNGFFVW